MITKMKLNIDGLRENTIKDIAEAKKNLEKAQKELTKAQERKYIKFNSNLQQSKESIKAIVNSIEEIEEALRSLVETDINYNIIREFEIAEKANLIAAGTYTPFQYDTNVMKSGHGNGEVMDDGSVASRTINYGVYGTMNIGAVMDDGYTASRTIGEGKSINYPNKPFKDTHATQSTEKGVIAKWIDKIVDKFKKIASTGAGQLMSLIGITKPQAIPETTTPDNTQINQDIGNNQIPNNGIGGNTNPPNTPVTPVQPSVTIPEVVKTEPITTPEPTISEKIQLSKEKMLKYFILCFWCRSTYSAYVGVFLFSPAALKCDV